MFIYDKKLQYPVKIDKPNPRLASIIISQYGGPDGELGAATRYLNQRYTMPSGKIIATLTDIGSEELGHQEIVASIIYQLTKNLTDDTYSLAIAVHADTSIPAGTYQNVLNILITANIADYTVYFCDNKDQTNPCENQTSQ